MHRFEYAPHSRIQWVCKYILYTAITYVFCSHHIIIAFAIILICDCWYYNNHVKSNINLSYNENQWSLVTNHHHLPIALYNHSIVSQWLCIVSFIDCTHHHMIRLVIFPDQIQSGQYQRFVSILWHTIIQQTMLRYRHAKQLG